MKEVLSIYIIFDHPKDYPNHWVVRRDVIIDGEVFRDPKYMVLEESLDTIKQGMEDLGLYFMPRWENDDPSIYGTYF